MEKDKKPLFIWTTLLLGNILVVFFLVFMGMSPRGGYFRSFYDLLYYLSHGVESEFLWSFAIGNFIAIISILLSKSYNKWKNFFARLLPSLLVIIFILISIYEYFYCTGFMCGFAFFVFGMILFLPSFIFLLFYLIGTYARRWNKKFVLSIIWIELISIIFLGVGIYIGFNKLVTN